ncbi:unnamed protein product [Prorocentrum cordatum]|uniref:Mitochondrial inner membrane protease subunit 2 n=1 Tax=Prorocentrum cordatum TaxID=2364126 RepID=A0ABN9S0C9_9DINO|nr:unnamed protein product [Polarella glacialis]
MAPSWRKVAKAAWIAVPPLVFIKDRWVWIYCVEGRSMSPTLNPQDTLLNRCFRDCVLVHRNAEFRKGDLVVLKDPGTNCHIVKRLVAQEHEFLAQRDGTLAAVPAGHVWVEGDNADMSVDSRTFGPVPMGLLDALRVSVVWPFWRARWIDDLADEGATAEAR